MPRRWGLIADIDLARRRSCNHQPKWLRHAGWNLASGPVEERVNVGNQNGRRFYGVALNNGCSFGHIYTWFLFLPLSSCVKLVMSPHLSLNTSLSGSGPCPMVPGSISGRGSVVWPFLLARDCMHKWHVTHSWPWGPEKNFSGSLLGSFPYKKKKKVHKRGTCKTLAYWRSYANLSHLVPLRETCW